jgi:hypothetical protein
VNHDVVVVALAVATVVSAPVMATPTVATVSVTDDGYPKRRSKNASNQNHGLNALKKTEAENTETQAESAVVRAVHGTRSEKAVDVEVPAEAVST